MNTDEIISIIETLRDKDKNDDVKLQKDFTKEFSSILRKLVSGCTVVSNKTTDYTFDGVIKIKSENKIIYIKTGDIRTNNWKNFSLELLINGKTIAKNSADVYNINNALTWLLY